MEKVSLKTTPQSLKDFLRAVHIKPLGIMREPLRGAYTFPWRIF